MSKNKSLSAHRLVVALGELTISETNVRKASPRFIESLAASILAKGLLQNLVVIPSSKEGVAKYEVSAGGRRYLAMMLLVETGKITLDYAVPVLLDTSENATVTSLTENFHREELHPIDEFRSFSTMKENGLSVDDIALWFGISNQAVIQRLALGAAAPELHDECLEGSMSLEQLKILCQLESHERQKAVWFDAPDEWSRRPDRLRNKIRGEVAVVTVSHKLVKFVGIETYLENGGAVNNDLFEPDTESVIANPNLIQSLAVSKLTAMAEELGWSWVEIALERDWQRLQGFKRVYRANRDLTESEEATVELWDTRQSELENLLQSVKSGSDEENTLSAEYDELNKVMAAFEERLLEWGDVKKIGGVYAYVETTGKAVFEEGLIRKEDFAKLRGDGDANGGKEEGLTPDTGISTSLKEYLASVRASVVQAEIVKNPRVGVVLLCHQLVMNTFFKPWLTPYKYLDVTLNTHTDALSKHGLEDLPSSEYLMALHDKLQGRLPSEEELLSFILELTSEELQGLTAYCVSYSLRLHLLGKEADSRYADLVNLLGIDVSSYWKPTTENYFMRLKKSQIISSLVDAGVDVEGLDENMKKGELAARAGDLIQSSPNWLPEGIAA
jgi:ParB family transcriptional regulator, chromosome partitioning protein